MSLIIELTHPLDGKAIDPTGYWYGFIVHHKEQNAETKAFERRFHTLEIAAIGLSSSEDGRQRGGFSWPVDHWRQLSTKPGIDKSKIVQGLYVSVDSVAVAFPTLRNISHVNLLIGRKGGEFALRQSDAAPVVTLYIDGKMQPCEIPDVIAQGQAAILPLYAGEPTLALVATRTWVGYPNFEAGIEGYRNYLLSQTVSKDTAAVAVTPGGKVAATEVPVRAVAAAAAAAAPPQRSLVSLTTSPPVVATQPAISNVITVTATASATSSSSKSHFVTWATVSAVVAVLGVVAVVAWMRPGTPPVASSPFVTQSSGSIATNAPAPPVTRPQPEARRPSDNSIALHVPATPAPLTQNTTAESIAASISVPTGNWPISREDLYKFGFDNQLGLVKQILDAAKSTDSPSFDAACERLRSMRPTRDWPKDSAVARRKFNEGIEQLINVAKSTSDDRAMARAIDLSEQFLMTHFGHSTAHLNLSFAQSAVNRGKAALPPAIHTIVFNPDGANSWVSLGVALARSGDESGGTGAFCTALRKVNFSDKTVAFFGRMSRGEDANYNYPEVIRAVSSADKVCPRERWAQSPAPQQ